MFFSYIPRGRVNYCEGSFDIKDSDYVPDNFSESESDNEETNSEYIVSEDDEEKQRTPSRRGKIKHKQQTPRTPRTPRTSRTPKVMCVIFKRRWAA